MTESRSFSGRYMAAGDTASPHYEVNIHEIIRPLKAFKVVSETPHPAAKMLSIT
jgi:hypothetical protein